MTRLSLSKTQKQIVDFGDGALLVVAGPGSGKTRVVTERIRRILSEEQGHFRVLALTFTNKAANEMKERLSEFPDIESRAFIGTLHSFCMEVLANRGKSVGINGLPNIFELYEDRKYILRQAVLNEPDLAIELRNAGDNKEQNNLLSRWLEMIGRAKNNLRLPEMIDDEIESRVYQVYNSGLRASNAVDYDDLLLLTYQIFIETPKIADFYRRQYKYICIDESQDLNEAQYQVLKALCGTEYKNIMMVGDPKQAIYMWRDANPKYLDLFLKDFGAKKIVLKDNYRCSKSVVNVAQRLAPEYSVEGQLPIKGEVVLLEGDNEEDEANQILSYLSNLIKNGHRDIEGSITLNKCALLARNRYVFTEIEKQLKRLEWLYYKQLTANDEFETDVIKDFELCLRLLANPDDKLHLEILLKRWNEDLSRIYDMSADIHGEILKLAKKKRPCLYDAIISLGHKDGNLNLIKALDKINEHAQQIMNDDEERELLINDIGIMRKHWDAYIRKETGGNQNISMFLAQVALGETQQPRQDGLALLTVHSAKGLEFDVVVVMGLMEGVFPDYRAKGASLDEEKRNIFVAVTRSKRLLALSYSKTKKMPWGDVKIQKRSRYLDEIFTE